jgi:outer membrane receptor protein involved in Fe transport
VVSIRFFVPLALAALLSAPAVAATGTHDVVAQATATVSGTVTDTTGAPVSGASVSLRGPSNYFTTTDSKGAFSLVNVAPGIYTVTITRPGYTTAVQNDIALVAGQTQNLTVSLAAFSFSNLRTIAHVSVNGRGAINQSPASINVIPPQEFINQAAPQVTRVLSQVPGLQISFPSNSANAAAPGAITIPNIRDAESYETATLIDGHYISVGQYGDNVTSFLNTFMFGSVEVIKGPGAESPVVNNAIGGTINLHTKDPTLTPTPEFIGGFDNRGGTFSDFGFSDTIDNRLGLVVAIATDNNPSAANGKTVYYDPSGGVYPAGNVMFGNDVEHQLGHTYSYITTQYGLLACCYPLQGFLNQAAELVKLQYHFSPATKMTVSYLGSQTYSDQNVNTSDFTNGIFEPGPGYTGPLAVGQHIQVANIFAGSGSFEFNNEPIFQAELSTTVGNDSLIARYYHATVERYQYQGTSPLALDYNNVTLNGVDTSTGAIYNGAPASVGYNDFYQEPEIDKLGGGSFEWNHPFAENDMFTLSVDRTIPNSTDYVYLGCPPPKALQGLLGCGLVPPGINDSSVFSLPPVDTQMLTTYLARVHFYVGSKWDVTLSNYLNTYSSTYAVNCTGSILLCSVYGEGILTHTTKNTHDDPRLGMVYRPNLNTALRLAVGSSIAPPFLGLLNQIAGSASYNSSCNCAIESVSNGNLKPETAFGYDIGADYRLNDQLTVISADGYLTNLFNRFFGETVATGLICGVTTSCPAPTPVGAPLLNSTNTNISNARFEGVELSIRRDPAVGFGFTIEGALERGYFYNLPRGFYCSPPTPACINNPANYNQNLNIIAGQNTNGITNGYLFFPPYRLAAEISYNGNMRIPYSQGNGEIFYTFPSGVYASLGDTYYGNNNSLNEPAFGIAYATIRIPVSKMLAVQISGDNIFNAYPGYLPTLGTGVPIPLANRWTGATTANVLGPATYRFMLMTRAPGSP